MGGRCGRAEIADLNHHWAGAYSFRHRDGGPYFAERMDNGAIICALTYEQMREKVATDYAAKPVPRDVK